MSGGTAFLHTAAESVGLGRGITVPPVAVLVPTWAGTVAAALAAVGGFGWTARALLEHPGKDHLSLRVAIAVMLLVCVAFGCGFLFVDNWEWAAAPALLLGVATWLGSKELTGRINADVRLTEEERAARVEKAGALGDKTVAFLIAVFAVVAFVSRL